MKSYSRFQTEAGKFAYWVYENHGCLSIEVTVDKEPLLLQNLIVRNLPLASKSRLTNEQWLEKAKELSQHLISRQ